MMPAESWADLDRRLGGDLDDLADFARELSEAKPAWPRQISVDGPGVEQGLAKLVLTLIELVRRLLEKQAIHRIEAGTVTDDQIERMGDVFLKLDEKMKELKATFGLSDQDLNINLGPLGDLM